MDYIIYSCLTSLNNISDMGIILLVAENGFMNPLSILDVLTNIAVIMPQQYFCFILFQATQMTIYWPKRAYVKNFHYYGGLSILLFLIFEFYKVSSSFSASGTRRFILLTYQCC